MHVTLTTLHVYLGLAPELTRPVRFRVALLFDIETVALQTLIDAQKLADYRQRHSNIALDGASTRRRRFSGEADVKAYYQTAKKKFAQALEMSEFTVS